MFPFMPSARAKNVFDIPYQRLYQIGFKGLIFDIDQTLVMHGAPATEQVIELFQNLKALGFQIFLLSNNDEERITEFNKHLSVPFIPLAEKPNPKNLVQIFGNKHTWALTLLYTCSFGAFSGYAAALG
ncbi:MAG: hypothetical protein E7B64_04495, partial [Streptococcus mitis]|nr:hypothetical protein [Streptococcus mitis]